MARAEQALFGDLSEGMPVSLMPFVFSFVTWRLRVFFNGLVPRVRLGVVILRTGCLLKQSLWWGVVQKRNDATP